VVDELGVVVDELAVEVVDELAVDADVLEVEVGLLMDGQGKALDSAILETDFDEVVDSLRDNDDLDLEDNVLEDLDVGCAALVDQANFEGGGHL
jgi:hypothetical protein